LLDRADEGSGGTLESIVDELESGVPGVITGTVDSDVTVEPDPQLVHGAVTAVRVE
jgi:hypothetical protein